MPSVSQVRVRFAPSPTGSLHIGGVRTALYNYLFSRSTKGVFLIRIEDTDRERSRPEYEKEILESLEWLGLRWDEPVVRQSERLESYRDAAQTLIRKGLAYVSEEEGRKAIKMKCPDRPIRFNDLVHGPIHFDGQGLGDFVIQKSDGYPTYHLASVVDDHHMRISHVIRGDDHISNTPRHLLLYEALGWTPPEFAHVPLVFGTDRTPLSKRHGHISLARYREEGYLASALLNDLALLGWSPPSHREFLTREELESEFRLEDINKTNACFDPDKLKWLNSEHLRKLPPDRYVKAVEEFLGEAMVNRTDRVRELALLFRDRIQTLGDLRSQASYFFEEDIELEPQAVSKYLSNQETRAHLEALLNVLEKEGDFSDPQGLERLLRSTAERLGIHARDLIHPTRVAVTGRSVSPGLFDVLVLLGKERVLKRIRYVIIQLSQKGSSKSKGRL